jgi:hydrogenase maturation protein HypF
MTAAIDPTLGRVARAVEVRGTVQGVGFRPFVWRLARRFGLAGWVRNHSGSVQILAEGTPSALDGFVAALGKEAPVLAKVDTVTWKPRPATGLDRFEVDESRDGPRGDRLLPPDVATCEACLAELADPEDRRFGYAFTNCTDCGPRFTIIQTLPYDRARTSMSRFPLCPECGAEYGDPGDRRFHAEPVACPACGPRLSLVDRTGAPANGKGKGKGKDPLALAAAMLRDGKVVAVKGLGGFHLACDATEEEAVATLRTRKRRPDKPFAVMVADLEQARSYFDLGPEEEALLSSPEAPIVLVADRGLLAPSVAPGFARQGAMLPATPLHHLLLAAVSRPLVMTSGNRTDEPICIEDGPARKRLGRIADAFLVHDRQIVTRADDSVARIHLESPVMLRRARGYAPAPIPLPVSVEPTLAVGAELHGAFCLASGGRAFLSPHLGTLDDDESMDAFVVMLDRYRKLLGIEPLAVAHDLHPDLLTTRLAATFGLPTVAVQHHHAHVAAVMAERGLAGPVIGVAFDGFGLGDDGTSWGGEFLVVRPERFDRMGHLRRVPQPGGDAAVWDPRRMALAYAADAGMTEQALKLLGPMPTAKTVLAQAEAGLASPKTSSAGRLFDAVAALTGICRKASFDGQPAMLLEEAADSSATFEYGFELEQDDGHIVIDTRPIVGAVIRDLRKGRAPEEVAGRFHRTLSAATLAVCRLIRVQTGVEDVVLAGGVFNNDLLLSDTTARLQSFGLRVHTAAAVPVGDGGISLGQVYVAGAVRGTSNGHDGSGGNGNGRR